MIYTEKNMFFHFSSYVASDSLTYIKFINLPGKQLYWLAFAQPNPKSLSFWTPEKTFSSIDFNVK